MKVHGYIIEKSEHGESVEISQIDEEGEPNTIVISLCQAELFMEQIESIAVEITGGNFANEFEIVDEPPQEGNDEAK